MKSKLKFAAHTLLVSCLFVVVLYTGFMGSLFSIAGMWVDETELMVFYAIVFVLSSLTLLLAIRNTKEFISIRKELFAR